MKKIIVFMGSLFAVVTAFALDTRAFKKDDPAYTPSMAHLEEKFQNAVAARKTYEQDVKDAQRKLLQTTLQGKVYKSIKTTHRFCLQNPSFANDSLCNGIYDLQEPALKQLKNLSQYQEEYLPLLIKADHNDLTVHILSRVRDFAAYQASTYGSQKEAMLAGVDSFSDYYTRESATELRSSQDVSSLMEQSRKEVREFIEKEIQ